MPDNSDISKPRTTDWHGHEHKDQNEIKKYVPAAIMGIVASFPGMLALFEDRPKRDEVQQMILREREIISPTLSRLENNTSDSARTSLEFSKAITALSTQMTFMSQELGEVRKEVQSLRGWWLSPPKKPEGSGGM